MSNEAVIDVRMPVRGDAFFDDEAVMSRLERDFPDADITVSTDPAITDGKPRVVADAAIHDASVRSVDEALATIDDWYARLRKETREFLEGSPVLYDGPYRDTIDQVAVCGAQAGVGDLLNAFEPDVVEGPEGEIWERMVVWAEQHRLYMRDRGPFMVAFEGDE